jgi:hypothetical protein
MSSAESVPEDVGRRSLWLTTPLYGGMLAIVVLDVWATAFWIRVEGSLGSVLALSGLAVALVLGGLLLIDARRQWLLSAPPDPAEPQEAARGDRA